MSSIIDYVKNYSDLTFKERPLSDVDSLVLSQLSYLFFDGLIDKTVKFETSLSDLVKSDNYDNLYNDVRVPEKNKELLETTANSIRYSNIRLGYYINEFSKETEKQFSAITFKLDKKLYYVAYRGTDATFIGWKEDMNMSYMSSVPAQKHAVSYFENLVCKFPRASYILGGHSKGGNLAVYAGIYTLPKWQKKIIDIYNHDGPGFKDEILNVELLNKMKFNIHKTIPQSSIVGMLLQKNEPYKVVLSNGFAIMQHDPFTWETEGIGFKYSNDITELSKKSGAIIEEWLEHTDDETRRVFVDALFSLVLNTNAAKFSDLQVDLKNNASMIFESIKTTNSKTRKTVTKTLVKLFAIIGDEIKRNASYRLNEIQMPNIFRRNER